MLKKLNERVQVSRILFWVTRSDQWIDGENFYRWVEKHLRGAKIETIESSKIEILGSHRLDPEHQRMGCRQHERILHHHHLRHSSC